MKSLSALNESMTTLASAATVNIGAALANFIQITGTTAITAFDNVQAGTRREVEFMGALTLTHNTASLILPNGVNISTATGDSATFISLGSGNWICVKYQYASQSEPKAVFIPTGYLGMIQRETANRKHDYLYIDCCDANFAPQNPTSFVLTIYQNGSLVYTSSAITTAATSGAIAFNINAGDLMRYVITNTIGLTGGVLISTRRVKR